MKRKRRPTNLRTSVSATSSEAIHSNLEDDIDQTRIRAVIQHKKLNSGSRFKKSPISANTITINNDTSGINSNNSSESRDKACHYHNLLADVEPNDLSEQADTTRRNYTNLDNNFVQASLKSKEELLMMRYVEDRISENVQNAMSDSLSKDECKNTPMEDLIRNAPDYLKSVKKTKISEDMLSSQMLTGIPEVDLGLESKIKNIEAMDRTIADMNKKKSLKSAEPSLVTTSCNPYFSKRFLRTNTNSSEDTSVRKL